MSQQRQAILNGDINKVVELLVNDSRTATRFHPKAEPSGRTNLICCICGASVSVDDKWLATSTPLDHSKVVCSDEHREELRQLRRDRHWG